MSGIRLEVTCLNADHHLFRRHPLRKNAGVLTSHEKGTVLTALTPVTYGACFLILTKTKHLRKMYHVLFFSTTCPRTHTFLRIGGDAPTGAS